MVVPRRVCGAYNYRYMYLLCRGLLTGENRSGWGQPRTADVRVSINKEMAEEDLGKIGGLLGMGDAKVLLARNVDWRMGEEREVVYGSCMRT